MTGPKKNKSLTHFFEVPFYNPTKPIINQTPEIFMLVCFTYFIKPNFYILSYHTFGLGSVRIEIYTFVLLIYLDQFVGYLRLSNTKKMLANLQISFDLNYNVSEMKIHLKIM